MRNGIGSQWRTSRRIGVTWSYFLLLEMSLSAALSTGWSPSRMHAGAPAGSLFSRSTLQETRAARAAFASPRGKALMQLLIRRADESNSRLSTQHGASWTGRTPEGRRDRAPRSRAVSRPHRHSDQRCQGEYTSAGLTPQEVRLLWVKPQSVGTNASIRVSAQHQAPSAAVQLLMEVPTFKAESHQR